jgi:hypothetical protein
VVWSVGDLWKSSRWNEVRDSDHWEFGATLAICLLSHDRGRGSIRPTAIPQLQAKTAFG